MMNTAKNHYELLGIARTASADEIKAAYRQQIKRHHPDRLAGRRAEYLRQDNFKKVAEIDAQIQQAQAICQQMNAAYGVLSDPSKRRLYDLGLTARYTQQTYTPPPRPTYTQTAYTPPARPRPKSRRSEKGIRVFVMIGLLLGFLRLLGEIERPNDRDPFAGARSVDYFDNTLGQDFAIQGQRSYDTGDYAAAISNYNQAIVFLPSAQLYYQRGLTYHALGDFTGAILDFTMALTLNPQLVEAYKARGDAFYGRWQQNGNTIDQTSAMDDFSYYTRQTGLPVDLPY